MGIKQLYNDNLRKLPNEYGEVSVMVHSVRLFEIYIHAGKFFHNVPKCLVKWFIVYKAGVSHNAKQTQLPFLCNASKIKQNDVDLTSRRLQFFLFQIGFLLQPDAYPSYKYIPRYQTVLDISNQIHFLPGPCGNFVSIFNYLIYKSFCAHFCYFVPGYERTKWDWNDNIVLGYR